MKILVFGAGVLGCNLARNFFRAGKDVKLLARGSWAEEIQKNGARGFLAGFWQLLVILSVMNLIDRFLVDGFWVGHTKAWTIPGTEDLKPYITAKDTCRKWVFGTVGMAVISAALSGIMVLLLH